MTDGFRLVCQLAEPLAGDPPHLDALLVSAMSRLHGKPDDADGAKLRRDLPPPPLAGVPIPVLRETICGLPVARCTAGILREQSDGQDHYCRRLPVERARLVAPESRLVVATTNAWAKSYRLPLRVRAASEIVWLAAGNRRETLRTLRRFVSSIGKKTAMGYGRVLAWEAERVECTHRHWPWWCRDTVTGADVLMRVLPAAWTGMPAGLTGARPGYGAVCDPYWHPDRWVETVEPC